MKGDICCIKDCETIVRTGKVCQVHAWRMRKYGSYEKPSNKRYGVICRVQDCDKERDGRHSICSMHRSRLSRYKSLDIPVITYPNGIVHECKVHGYITLEQSYKNQKTGHFTCVICRRENDHKFFENNPHIDRNAYKHHYYIKNGKVKLSKDEYEKMLNEQKGLCAICKKEETARNSLKKYGSSTKRLAIDHCHESQKIRGLLCQMCNQALGAFKDSIPTLKSAIHYLKLHENINE